MRFRDPERAARFLAIRLMGWRDRAPLVLGLPNGAVPMAGAIVAGLGGDLDVALVDGVSAPGTDPRVVAWVSEWGDMFPTEHAFALDLGDADLRRMVAPRIEHLRGKRAAWKGPGEPPNPEGRVVILVECRAETGGRLLAAIHCIRRHRPARLIVAVAVAQTEILARLRKAADEVICLEEQPDAASMEKCLASIPEVTDAEVGQILRQAAARAPDQAVLGDLGLGRKRGPSFTPRHPWNVYCM